MDGHYHRHGDNMGNDSEDGQLQNPTRRGGTSSHHHRTADRHSKAEPNTGHRSEASNQNSRDNNGDNNDEDYDDDDTADSLEIKPPQAMGGQRGGGGSGHHRYKEKRTTSSSGHGRGAGGDRKHSSKEHRHKSSNRGGGDHQQRDRRRMELDEREQQRERRHGSHRSERPEYHMERQPQQQLQQHQHQMASRPASGRAISPERYEMNTRAEAIEREQQYRMAHKERDREKQHQRTKESDQERARITTSPDKSEAERALEDLRSRLLIKRSKFETEKQQEASQPEYRSDRKTSAYNSKRDRDREYFATSQPEEPIEYSTRELKASDKKKIIEVIDSPDTFGSERDRYKERREQATRHSEAQPMIIDDPELVARRAKLLDAEREMARRKEMARDELEARRFMRREREIDNPSSPRTSPVPHKRKKRSNKDPEDVESGDDDVVHVSDDQSDENASGSEDSEDSSSHSDNEDTDEEDNGPSDDGELPVSPLSIGELSKSERRRQSRSRSDSADYQSRSRSRSRSRSSHGRSHSRSQSKSRSRSPSNKNHRLRNRTPSSDFEPAEPEKPSEPTAEELAAKEAELEAAKEALLPSYFPGVQGCRSVEEFQCLNRIEEGTYGVVYRARDKRTEEIVALKRLKMEKEKEGFPITSLREINTLLKGQHPNIVTVREIVVGSNMDKIFIVMDYVEHDLKSLMETMKNRKKSFLPGEVKCLTQQLLRAVGHLHDNWILHRDLKTSNLLLSHRGILKVGDFGLAREYGSPLKPYTSIVVTLWYRSPELLLCCKEYSHQIDMWSVGCIFAEFLAMGPLFPGKSEVDQLSRIFKDLGTPNEKIWPGYNELPAVQKMTFTDYPVSNLRKKFAHLTSELGLGLLQGLLTYDPKQRLSAEMGLRNSYFKEQPLPIDPAMFPTWPAKSELGSRKALASSPKPPSGGGQFKQLGEAEDNHGFVLNALSGAGGTNASGQPAGAGFSLRF